MRVRGSVCVRLCVVPLCVSNSSVFNEISHFLYFFYLDSISCLHTGEKNSFTLAFSSPSLLVTPLCTNCYSALSVKKGMFFSKWLSFAFKLVWADLPCYKISTCQTVGHAIENDCNNLSLSRMGCHCLDTPAARWVSSEKSAHAYFSNILFQYLQMIFTHSCISLLACIHAPFYTNI